MDRLVLKTMGKVIAERANIRRPWPHLQPNTLRTTRSTMPRNPRDLHLPAGIADPGYNALASGIKIVKKKVLTFFCVPA
ncbi:MAG: hypothetical protein WAN04_11085 [Candidatus Udaeobacter sp.]